MKRGLAGIALGVAVLAVLPFVRESLGLTGFYVVILYTIFFWTAQATSWNILSGYAGYFSFGQGAFVGVGAYTAAVLVGRHGVDYFLTIPVAGAFSVRCWRWSIGAVAFRLRSLRGEIFALLTLAVPFILASVARLNTTIDGGQGIIVPTPELPDCARRVPGLPLPAQPGHRRPGASAIAYAIQHSRFGWALTAIRDAEDVAEGLGVPTFRYKMLAIAASGLIGGISGAAYAQQIGFVTVQAVFGLTIPLFVIVMSVLGGRTHWLGPVIGATFIVLLQDRLVVAGLESWRLIIFGVDPRLRRRRRAGGPAGAAPGAPGCWRSAPSPSVAVGSVLVGVSDELLDAIGVGAVGAAAVALWPGLATRRSPGRPVVRRRSRHRAESAEPADARSSRAEPRRLTRHGGAAIVECIGAVAATSVGCGRSTASP